MTLQTTRPQTSWRSGSLLPALPQTSNLEIYDLRSAAPEVRLSVATLAGLVNRGPARLYLVESGDDEFWLGEIEQVLPCIKMPIASTDLMDYLLTAYREHVEGLVIYDPALVDTINVATTLAALRNGIVVAPSQLEGLQKEPYHLPVLADLRTYGWKKPLQAYAWAYQHLLPECSHKLVAGLAPGIHGSLRACLVTHRVFIHWLDGRKRLPVPQAGWLSQRGLFQRILASFPPGSLHLGWFIDEPSGVRLNSSAALLTFASDFCTNLEIWSNLTPPVREIDVVSPPVAVAPEQREGHNTTYLSFTISDGDNLQYCQHRLLRLWKDPVRGTLPLGWTITPALQHLLPYQAAFYRQSATERDEFIAGPSGAAYILPSYWPDAERDEFLALTAEYMQDMHLSVLQILDSKILWGMKFLNPRLQRLFVEHLAPHGLRGILSGCGSYCSSWHQRAGLPIYQNLGLASSTKGTLRLIESAARRGTRYINIYVFAWQMTPGDLQAVVKQLGDDFVVVTPGSLLAMLEREQK